MNNTRWQQDQQRSQMFEQQAQQAAQGEQKARNFNAKNSNDQNIRQGANQNWSTNQEEMLNQTMSEQEKLQKQRAFQQN